MRYTLFKLLLVLTILYGAIGQVRAQNSEVVDTKATSLSRTTMLLLKMDSTHRADSLRREMLVTEIEEIKGLTANKQREKLLQKLQEQEAEDSIKKATQIAELNRLKSSAKGFPVVPFVDTLFFVYTRIGSFSPADRANAIAERIEKLYHDYGFKPDSLAVHQNGMAAEIIYKDMVVMSVNELEAMWFNKKPGELANEYKAIIALSIKEERRANGILNISLRIGAVVLIIVGIYLIIILINKLFKRLNERVIQLKDSILSGIKFKGYQFLDTERELQVVLFLLNILRLFIIGIALYIALPLVFSVFPWSQGIAETLFGWVLTPLKGVVFGFIKYLPNLFTILVIGAITHYVIKFLRFITDEIHAGVLTIPGFYPDWAKPTFNIVRFLLYAFSFIIIFPYLPGSDSPVFQGVSVFLGILFSLGSSSAIANAVAGLVITYMRPFKIGDRIKIGEIAGDVIEKSLLVTRIRTIKNEDITMPNSMVLSGHTINYTTSAQNMGLILHTSVTIGYDVPWKQIHELLKSAAISTRGILQDEKREPFVLQTSLDDFYVSYQINAFTDESHRMASIYSELHQHIQDKFNEAGVEILSPHYRAARDGNMTTIPSNYLSKDYQAPSFNVSLKESSQPNK